MPGGDGTSGQSILTDGNKTLYFGTPAGGDMLQSTYDANTDSMIDDAAIAASIARDSEIPTAVSALTNDSGFITAAGVPAAETDPTAEPALGNPASDGYILSSTVGGARSWVADGGSVDLTAPGPIGSVAPDTGEFTDLIADTFDFGTPASGTTGELVLFEDPDNGGSSLTLKAPADIAADVVWTLPATDGASGQVLTTNAAGIFAWSDAVLDSDIGIAVQAYDADLVDLADGSLTGSKVGTGINGSNITTGTVAEARLDAAIARDSEVTGLIGSHSGETTSVHGIADTSALALTAAVTAAPVAAPTTATDTCTAGTWAYDAAHYYLCTTTDIVAGQIDVSFALATGTITSLTDPIGTNAVVGHTIVVSGSTSNNGTFTVASITDANNLVVAEALVDEIAGAIITVKQDSWLRAALAVW
jgi:hypothetical protein